MIMLEDNTSISTILKLAYIKPILIKQYFALLMSYSNRKVSLLKNIANSGKKVVLYCFTLKIKTPRLLNAISDESTQMSRVLNLLV